MSNRSILVDSLAEAQGLSKRAADDLLVSLTNLLVDHLTTHGEAVLPGFGRFRLETRAARKGHNPKTGEPIDIAEKQVVKFKVFPSTDVGA